jgi:hypothetical protein
VAPHCKKKKLQGLTVSTCYTNVSVGTVPPWCGMGNIHWMLGAGSPTETWKTWASAANPCPER